MVSKKKRVFVTCPIPEDKFPWNSHFSGYVNPKLKICPVCHLNLDDFDKVADKVFEKYISFLGRFGDEVKVLATEKFTTHRKDNPNIKVRGAYLLTEVRGVTLILYIFKEPDQDFYLLYGGQGNREEIKMYMLGGIDLGIIMQLTRLPSWPHPLLSGK
jgi:hypothetical protein